MKRFFWLILIFLLAIPLQAQDDLTPYEIALQRIEEARISGATELHIILIDLSEIPPELWQLHSLQVLDLELNNLQTLPAEIGQLSNLKELYLSGNKLSTLPPEIGNLSKLEALGLGDNLLSSLPQNVGQLADLMILNLSENQFKSLPIEVNQLANLCHLNISHNRFEHLPKVLSELTNLEHPECSLVYHENPLISPPQEVIDEGTEAILHYLRNQAWWHLQKMIVYGASVVGGLTLLMLGLRWRYRRQHIGKEKREV